MSFKASAPGSLMLLGEYGVLHGKHALVCAVDKRMIVTLTPRQDEEIHINAVFMRDNHPLPVSYVTELSNITIEEPFKFVLAALKNMRARMKFGCDIDIKTEFSDQVGLGSSAAVTIATLTALHAWLNIKVQPLDLVRQGRTVVRSVQGSGSGADVAASVYGGIVGYQAQPMTAEKFSQLHPLTAVYAGYKTPTVQAIKLVEERFTGFPGLLRSLIQGIGQCALDGMIAVRRAEWSRLGEIMSIQQGMMESLGVCTPDLRHLVDDLRAMPQMLGAKISGAGLGDCVIGLGTYSQDATAKDLRHIPLEMTLQGVSCEKT